jgi:PilZ domain
MGRRREPRKEIQVPVRIFGTDSSGQVFSAKATTVNVSQQGVELSGVECSLSVDETVGVTYGKNKAHFRVKWVGQPGTPKAGRVGLLNASPDRPLWDFPLPAAVLDNYRIQFSEHRKHPRFKCQNSIEIHTPAGASFRATISDLSVGGCYIEMALPLQIKDRVRVGLWIADTKVMADCEVAYSTPGCGVGLRFLRISESDLERIQQFLAPLKSFARTPGSGKNI